MRYLLVGSILVLIFTAQIVVGPRLETGSEPSPSGVTISEIDSLVSDRLAPLENRLVEVEALAHEEEEEKAVLACWKHFVDVRCLTPEGEVIVWN